MIGGGKFGATSGKKGPVKGGNYKASKASARQKVKSYKKLGTSKSLKRLSSDIKSLV